MFSPELKGKGCYSQRDFTAVDGSLLPVGGEFILTGNYKLSVHSKLGRIQIAVGLVPHRTSSSDEEIFVDAHDIIVSN